MSTNQNKQVLLKRPRVSFTQKEDEIISFFVNIIGTNKWSIISKYVKNRTAKQCRDRYMNYLKPGLSNIEWTPDEDELLLELYSKYGPKWSTINKNFNNRNQVSLKNRFIFLQKQKNQVKEKVNNNNNQNYLERNKETESVKHMYTLPDITYYKTDNPFLETEALTTKNDDSNPNMENILDFLDELDEEISFIY